MADVDSSGMIFVGKGDKPALMSLAFANRHGLVTGATGTGKTVSLQVLAEGLSRAGVPVFAADIKGDLSGIAAVGEAKDALVKRAKDMGFDYQPDEFPAVFWDVFGAQGHPVRATISEMGPLLLSRMMDLNDVQEGVLNIAFRVADEQGLPVLDLKDLRAMLGYIAEHAAELTTQYGNVSKATVGTIQRQLLVLENQGATKFFGEPALALHRSHEEKQRRPWLRQYPRRRQADGKPAALCDVPAVALVRAVRADAGGRRSRQAEKLVFFFDEVRICCSTTRRRRCSMGGSEEQVVRLIRSKGVGVFFVTQNPVDVPDKVLGQLGNRDAACAARLPRRATRRPCSRPRRRHSDPTPSSTPHRSSPNWPRARRWCRSSKATAPRRWSSASWCARRRRASGRSRRRSVPRSKATAR